MNNYQQESMMLQYLLRGIKFNFLNINLEKVNKYYSSFEKNQRHLFLKKKH